MFPSHVGLLLALTATMQAASEAPSPQPTRKKPNIVVVMTDDHRWDSLGCYGDKVVKTPNIDALAKEGTKFENAFSCAMLCLPSRTSFFTGKYASRNERYDCSPKSCLRVGEWTFFEELKKAGYALGFVGKNHTINHEYARTWFDVFEEYSPWGKESGTMRDSDRALAEWRSTSGPVSKGGKHILLEGLIDRPEPFAEKDCMEARIGEDAANFVRQHAGKPFFLHMAFPQPHWPNVVCEPYFSMYKKHRDQISLAGMDEMDWDSHPFAHYVQSQSSGFDKMSKEDRRKILAVMLGQISFVDKSVGQLVDALRKAGVYDNTLIIFTADQGCLGGQYGLPCKTKGFYEPLIRIPFIVKMPGDRELHRVTPAQINNIDIMPTVLDYAGVKFGEKIDGQSFLPVLQGKTDRHRDVIFSEVGEPRMPPAPMSRSDYAAYNKKRCEDDNFWFIDYTTLGRCAMIREDGWKYCFYNGDMEELYNYAKDPLELHNLAADPEYKNRKEAMREKLFRQGFVGIGDAARQCSPDRPDEGGHRPRGH